MDAFTQRQATSALSDIPRIRTLVHAFGIRTAWRVSAALGRSQNERRLTPRSLRISQTIKSLLKKIQSKFVELDRDYLGIETPVEKYIVSSAYGPHAGLVGACTLAERAWQMR
jgi:hypothetical protein